MKVIIENLVEMLAQEIKQIKKFSLIKAKEILDLVNLHSENVNWRAIDDLNLHNDIVEKHQIKTDPIEGLTQCDIDKAERILLKW